MQFYTEDIGFLALKKLFFFGLYSRFNLLKLSKMAHIQSKYNYFYCCHVPHLPLLIQIFLLLSEDHLAHQAMTKSIVFVKLVL